MTTKKKDLVQLGVLMTPKQLKLIDKEAKELGLSRSAFVRYALHQYMNSLEREIGRL